MNSYKSPFQYLLLSGLIALGFSLFSQLSSGVVAEQRQKNALEQLSSPERTTLKEGEVTLSREASEFTARVLINAPTTAAWEVLTDYDNFEEFFPNVEKSRLLESDGNTHVFEQVNVTKLLFFTNRSRVVLATTETYPTKIEFRLVEGDVKTLNGVWQVEPIVTNGKGKSILVTHKITIDPEGEGLSRNLFFQVYPGVLKDTLAALKTETEQRAGE